MNLGNRRVVVTGIGAVTPLGASYNRNGRNEFWENMVAEKSAISVIEGLPGIANYHRILGAEIKNWNLEDYFSKEEIGGEKSYERILSLDKAIQFALAATKLALKDARLLNASNGNYNSKGIGNNFGFYTGNGMQCIQSIEAQSADFAQKYALELGKEFLRQIRNFKSLLLEGTAQKKKECTGCIVLLEKIVDEELRNLSESKNIHEFKVVEPYHIFKEMPATIFNYLNYAICGYVAQLFGLHGPTLAVNSACSSGNDAIIEGFKAILCDDVDVVIAGGTEAPIASPIVSMFNRLGVMSKTGVKPGDKKRDGFALGEGAGYLILEELEHAKSRVARIYSELVSYGQSNDAYHMLSLHPSGQYVMDAVRKALIKAEIKPEDVDYINPHTTSTKQCDEIESKIIRDVFGSNLENILIHPSKCMTGHFQAGAGAVEAVLINLIFQNNYIPGIPEAEDPDPECVKYVPQGGVKRKINTALSMSLGFGGHNSITIFRRYQLSGN